MKAVVLGAGLVGVTTAYELIKNGYDVTIIDQGDAPANFTSHANAGLIAPAHAYPWASPQAPIMLIKSMFGSKQALRFYPKADLDMWRWMAKFAAECTAARAYDNTKNKAVLSNYSQQVFRETVDHADIEYCGRRTGLVYLYGSEKAYKSAYNKALLLQDLGCDVKMQKIDELIAQDPAFANVKSQFAGAIRAENDESGDARLFTKNLANWCQQKGAKFRYNTKVYGFQLRSDLIQEVQTDKHPESGDIFVLAMGVYSMQIAKQLGVNLPIYPVKGYSVTVPVEEFHEPPSIGGVDEENLMAFCPLGDRLRLTATAEFSGYSTDHKPSDFEHILDGARRLFPNGADYGKPKYWAGLRPMTPDGSPILGRKGVHNLWYNTGHGHMGWTMCHGTAKITADMIVGKKPEIEVDHMILKE